MIYVPAEVMPASVLAKLKQKWNLKLNNTDPSPTKRQKTVTLSVRLSYDVQSDCVVEHRGPPSCRVETLPIGSQKIRYANNYEHITPLLRELHWLQSPERIDFKLAVLVYRRVHGLANYYLSDYFQRVAFSNRRRLRSSSSSLLLIRRTRLITVGDRAFPVAGSRLWNSLQHVVTSAPTFAVFRKRLKSFFSCSFAL